MEDGVIARPAGRERPASKIRKGVRGRPFVRSLSLQLTRLSPQSGFEKGRVPVPG